MDFDGPILRLASAAEPIVVNLPPSENGKITTNRQVEFPPGTESPEGVTLDLYLNAKDSWSKFDEIALSSDNTLIGFSPRTFPVPASPSNPVPIATSLSTSAAKQRWPISFMITITLTYSLREESE